LVNTIIDNTQDPNMELGCGSDTSAFFLHVIIVAYFFVPGARSDYWRGHPSGNYMVTAAYK